MKKAIAVLAWYFLAIGSGDGNHRILQTVGPFDSKAACKETAELVRKTIKENIVWGNRKLTEAVSDCWESTQNKFV